MKPIKLLHASLFFGTGTLLFLFNERVVLPFLGDQGFDKILLFIVMALPHILFFTAALVCYKLEGNKWKLAAFRSRFRFEPIKGKLWYWTLLAVLGNLGLYLATYYLGYPLLKAVHEFFPSPDILNEIMGNGEVFAGHTIEGNWWLILLFLFYYFFNVLGEEFLWRGYLFPRQELTHGKYTWVVHGLLWAIFHLFAPYNAILVLPGALLLSYIVQRTQNNTIFLVAHAVMNGIPLGGLILNIIG